MRFRKPKLREDSYKVQANRLSKQITKAFEETWKSQIIVDNGKLKTMYEEYFNGYKNFVR